MANYHCEKGQRYKKGTIKTEKGRLHVYSSIIVDGHWWCEVDKKWVKDVCECTVRDGIYTGSDKCGIHSVKAAERHIRKHNEIQKGTKCSLISNFIGLANVDIVK